MSEARATTADKPSLWSPGDRNALFGFGTNVLINMLTLCFAE